VIPYQQLDFYQATRCGAHGVSKAITIQPT
jgi:hypothetical protein